MFISNSSHDRPSKTRWISDHVVSRWTAGMKILQVIPSVAAVHGGPSRAIVEIERALSGRGIEVTTVTTNDNGTGQRLDVPCNAPVQTPFATRWYFPLDLEFYKVSMGLRSWLKRNIQAFDAVHAHSLFSFAPVVAASLAHRKRVPYVLRPLGVLNRYGMASRRALLKQLSLGLIERRLIRKASAIHFTSLDEQTEADEIGLNSHGVVIPLGIDLGSGITKKGWRAGEPITLLFLSRIDPKKNLESLLEALTLQPLSGLDITLSVAGDGDADYVRKLKQMADRLGVGDRVKWLGYLEGTKKAEAFALATFYVLPSYSENFGIAVAEALGAGLPCIVSRQVAISNEIAKAGAGVVSETDPASIAACISSVMLNRNDYDGMSMAARSLALENFSTETMGVRLEQLYQSIASLNCAGGPRHAFPAVR
jgi:glycosyltransferase involved in cell wall biosynthesis